MEEAKRLFGNAGCMWVTSEEELVLKNEILLLKVEYPKLRRFKVFAKIQGVKVGENQEGKEEDETEESDNSAENETCYIVSAHDLTKPSKFKNVYFYCTSKNYCLKKLAINQNGSNDETEASKNKLEKDLEVFIRNIGRVSHIIPRDSYTLDENGHLIPNEFYAGLDEFEATHLDSYRHLSSYDLTLSPTNAKRFDEHGFVIKDFLPIVGSYVPNKAWTLQFLRSKNLIIIRSLIYLGYVFVYELGTKKFADFYVGDGTKNQNFSFMV